MMDVKKKLIQSFERNKVVEVPLKKKSRNGDILFSAILRDEGIEVSNLGTKPMLEFKAFELVVELLENNPNNTVLSGSCYKYKLGEGDCTILSVNGCLAYNLDCTLPGKSVFRRSSAINNILVWCGLCEHIKGGLKLKLNR